MRLNVSSVSVCRTQELPTVVIDFHTSEPRPTHPAITAVVNLFNRRTQKLCPDYENVAVGLRIHLCVRRKYSAEVSVMFYYLSPSYRLDKKNPEETCHQVAAHTHLRLPLARLSSRSEDLIHHVRLCSSAAGCMVSVQLALSLTLSPSQSPGKEQTEKGPPLVFMHI